MVFSVGKIVCSKLLTRNYGRRDVCDGTTPLLQHAFGQPLGVALPGFRELDDLSSDGVTGRIDTVSVSQRHKSHL
jgi:hypothetical protein